MKKKIVRIVIFCSLLVFALINVMKILGLKEGTGFISLNELYAQEEQKVDVLFLGSSHSFVNTNIPYLWENYGMAGFCLGGPEQMPWESYHYLEEALKSQSPSIVVYETYTVLQDRNYNKNDGRIIENTAGLNFSWNRLTAIQDNAPKNLRTDLLLDLSLFHGRYEELTESDFDKESWVSNEYFMGCNPRYGVQKLKRPQGTDVTMKESLNEKEEEFLRKIASLCKDNQIQLVLTLAPAPVVANKSGKINEIARIAEEEQIPFINFNSDEMFDTLQFDFSSDFYDKGHLNVEGSIKYSSYMGEYLTKNYKLDNRKQSKDWLAWQDSSNRYEQSYNNHKLVEATNETEYLNYIKKGDYKVFVLASDWNQKKGTDGQKELMLQWGIDGNQSKKNSGIVIEDNQIVYDSAKQTKDYYEDENGTDCWLQGNVLKVNDLVYGEAHGLSVVVYDEVHHKVVDMIYWKDGKMLHQ